MEINLLYGRDGYRLRLPENCQPVVIEKNAMPVLADPAQAVNDALDQGNVSELANSAKTACILICDITRPVPNHLFLRPMIERLMAAGMNAADITVLVATGLHRPNEGDELAELVGDQWVLDTVRVENHFARNDADHVLMGETARGTVVRLDRRLVEADLKIATGLVEPHFMAGYSGGRKVIAPGVAHAETITTFHNYRFMSDENAANCVLENNPLHEEQLAIVQMLGGAHALNTVIDDQRRLAFVNFGEIVESHLDAVNFVSDYAEVRVGQKFHTVVTTAAGYPLDKTYYQTVKGMVGPMDILAEGGDLIVVSECSEGIGSEEYIASQRQLIAEGQDAFLKSIAAKSHANIDEWQTQMLTKPKSVGQIYLYSGGLTGESRSLTGVEHIADVATMVATSCERHGSNQVAVIPEGPYVVPRV
ncbi:MAG: nickel-dependent lactate racemase [Pseudomonadota bacterium]